MAILVRDGAKEAVPVRSRFPQRNSHLSELFLKFDIVGIGAVVFVCLFVRPVARLVAITGRFALFTPISISFRHFCLNC